jgi:peptide chain release factor 1
MKILSARLLSAREHAAEDKRGQARREQVKSGDRSDKMRTYNFPQNRVTDHKAGVTVHRLKGVLDGDLDLLLETERTGNGGNGDGGED